MIRLRAMLILAFLIWPVFSGAAPNDPVRSGIAEVNGTKLYYEVTGKGPAVVLIHSGGFDRRIWDDQVPVLADKYTVIRYDVRGYGRSATPTKPYSDDEDLFQLLTFLKVPKAHLIGLSMGGRIAIDFTLTHPAMVASLTAVAPGLSGFPFAPEDTIEMMKIVYSIQNDDGTPAGEVWLKSAYNAPAMEIPAVAAKLRPMAIENSKVWLINFFFPRPAFPLAVQRLGEIKTPMLVVVGTRDVPTIMKIVDTLEKNVPGVKKVVVPGAGHMVNIEKPAEFNKAVVEFLGKNAESQ